MYCGGCENDFSSNNKSPNYEYLNCQKTCFVRHFKLYSILGSWPPSIVTAMKQSTDMHLTIIIDLRVLECVENKD